jgi:hypothetical protein
MNNPETLTTIGTQDTGRRQTKKEENTTQHNTTQKTKIMSNTDPAKKNRGWTHVLAKGRQFLPVLTHPTCYLYNQDVFHTPIYTKKPQIK